jgi:hypothetical protein
LMTIPKTWAWLLSAASSRQRKVYESRNRLLC